MPTLAAGLAALHRAVAALATAPLPAVLLPSATLPSATLPARHRLLLAVAGPDPAGPLTAGATRAGGGAGAAAGTAEADREPVDRPADPTAADPTAADPTAAAAEGVLALVARAQAGDAEAFGCLYDRYVDLVYRYIYYRVGTQALAEDLTSETFLRALRRITSFTWQGRDIGAWFVTIARNLVADHYKSGRFRLEVQVADMLDADRAQDGPEGEVLDALTNRTLLEAVKRLNPEQQECIVLRFLQGLSVSETALAMGKNEGAIKALQYRAVRTLGRLLPEGFGP